jgi:hypothetical protein
MVTRSTRGADVLRKGTDHATADAHYNASPDRPRHARQTMDDDGMLESMGGKLRRVARVLWDQPSR